MFKYAWHFKKAITIKFKSLQVLATTFKPNKTCQLSRLDPSDQDTEWPASFCPKTQRKCENTSDLVFINQVKAKVPLIVDAFIRVIFTCIINFDTCTCKMKNNLGTWREMDIITPLNVPVCMWGRCCRSKYLCWVSISLFLNQVKFRWHLISGVNQSKTSTRFSAQ